MPRTEHSNHLERRITKLEVKADDHTERLKSVEAKMITPRDIRMMIAGIMTIAAALAGKVPWSDVVTVFTRH